MKTALFAALTFAAVSVLKAATPVEPPSLTLDKAAAIAQKKLEELKLPPEFFLRKIDYYPTTSAISSVACYIATYEPTKLRIIARVQPGQPTPTPEPNIATFIYVFMDGTAKFVEQDMRNPRSVGQ